MRNAAMLLVLLMVIAGSSLAEGTCGGDDCTCQGEMEDCTGSCCTCDSEECDSVCECDGDCTCDGTVESCTGDCCTCAADCTCQDEEAVEIVEEPEAAHGCGGCPGGGCHQ